MKDIIQGLRFGILSTLYPRFLVYHSGNRGLRTLCPGLCILSIISFLLLSFLAPDAKAEASHLQVINAGGEEIASLELLENQSTKYVLEKELIDEFGGTGRKHERLMGRTTFTMMGKRVILTLRRRQLNVGNEVYVLSSPPDSISGKIAVPVEFLTKVLPAIINKKVELDQENWILKINSESFLSNGDTGTDQQISPVPSAEFRVIIDPGHGGRDTGSRTRIGQEEKEQALQIAQQIKELLAMEKGMDVYLTRSTDRYMTAAERINRANDLGGHVYLSIHFNWSPSQKSRGFRIYVNSDQIRLGTGSDLGAEIFSRGKSRANEIHQANRFLPQSKRLANEVEKRLKNVELMGEPYKEVFLAHMDDLSMPGTLVEVLYFSNPKDRSILSRPDFINSVSRAFCDSIIALREALSGENAL